MCYRIFTAIMLCLLKLHLHVAQMRWQLMFFGAPQWERHALLHDICWSAEQGDEQQAWCFKCQFCGLLAPNGGAMYSHVTSYHPSSTWIYRRHTEKV